MNVALLTEDLHRGGAERIVGELAAGLARRGHRVGIFCLKPPGPPPAALADAGVTVRTLTASARSPALHGRLLRWLRAGRIDIAHAHSSAAVLAALPATLLLRLPLVQTRHGALLGRPSRYRRLAERAGPLLAGVAIVAETLRAELRPAALRGRAVHVPNGIDRPPVPRLQARSALAALCGRPLDGPVVLSVGTICPEKDQRTLLAAFAQLRRHLPGVTLVCIGRKRGAAYAAAVAADCRRLALDGRVVFTGPVPEAWRLLAGADVFCLSSRTEAMPNVIVEAMSQRVPIVATAVGDVGPCATAPAAEPAAAALLRHGDTGLLVPPGQPQALAAALLETVRDPAAARARAERAAQDYVRRFRSERMVARYEELYADCLRRRGRRVAGRGRARRSRPPPRVLMAGPPPDQVGGMNSAIEAILSSPLAARCVLHRYAHLPAARPAARAGAGPNGAASRPRRVARLLAAGLRHLRGLADLARTIRRLRSDIVHIHTCSFQSFYRSLLDAAVVRLAGRRVCLHIHGGRFAEFCAASGRGARWLIRRGAEAADAVIVLSPRWATQLRPYLGASRLAVVPNGVAVPAVPRPARPPGGPCRFVYLGPLSHAKGLAELIEAADRLRSAGVPFELVFAGPAVPADPTDWRQVIAWRGLSDHVRLAGTVRGPARTALLAASDCLVLPSHSEGLPMVVLEAAAAGLAVVATAVGSLPEMLAPSAEVPALAGAAGIAPLVPPGDAAALAREMAALARDPALRRRVADNLRQRVRTAHSLDLLAARLGALYGEIRARPRAALLGTGERLAGRITYPVHERLRGRPTLRVYRRLQEAAGGTPADVQRDAAERLRALLRFAAARLPYYAERFARFGVDPAGDDPHAELRKLPPLDKSEVRAHGQGMLWRDVPGGPRLCTTGGTTGDTLRYCIDRVRQAEDLGARLYMQALFGVPPGARRIYLWGSPIEARGPRLKAWRDRLINERLLSAFDLAPARLAAHLARIRRFRPRVLYGYPTALTLLARHAAPCCGPHDFPFLRLVVLTGEEISADQLARIRAVLGCPVAAEYGNREVGLIAHECPAGGLHILAPHIHVEVLSGGAPAPPGQPGEIVCTTLNTRAQPLIRYRLRDVGALLPGPCPCGLPLPLLRLVGGRVSGLLALPDGRLCHGAISSYMVRDEPGIVQFRTHQRRLDWIEVLLVADGRFRKESLARIAARYRRVFGPAVHVDVRVVDRIPPDPSGKRRHVVSDVAPNCSTIELADPAAPDHLSAP